MVVCHGLIILASASKTCFFLLSCNVFNGECVVNSSGEREGQEIPSVIYVILHQFSTCNSINLLSIYPMTTK